jgi:hypothetical protein
MKLVLGAVQFRKDYGLVREKKSIRKIFKVCYYIHNNVLNEIDDIIMPKVL